MTLRKRLGADAERFCERIDDLLDSEDAIIVLADGHRAIHYAHGFGLSACHHELLAVHIERAIRGVTQADPVEVDQPVVARGVFTGGLRRSCASHPNDNRTSRRLSSAIDRSERCASRVQRRTSSIRRGARVGPGSRGLFPSQRSAIVDAGSHSS